MKTRNLFLRITICLQLIYNLKIEEMSSITLDDYKTNVRDIQIGSDYNLIIDSQNNLKLQFQKQTKGGMIPECDKIPDNKISASEKIFCGINNEFLLSCWQLDDILLKKLEIAEAIKQSSYVHVGSNNVCAISLEGVPNCQSQSNNRQQRLQMDVDAIQAKIYVIKSQDNNFCALISDWLKCWQDQKRVKWIVSVKQFSIASDRVCQINGRNKIRCFNFESFKDEALPSNAEMKQVSISDHQTCAIGINDKLNCWDIKGVQIVQPAKIMDAFLIKVSTSKTHMCVLTIQNNIYCQKLQQ